MSVHREARSILATLLFAALILASLSHTQSVAAVTSASPAKAQGTQTSKSGAPVTAKAKKKRPRKKSSRRKRRKGQLRPTPERIREIQTALIQKGYFAGEPTGSWDARTTDAMRRFQQTSGLEPTGRLDAPSLIKLGLGPETAGVGAPRPPAGQTSPSASSPPDNPTRPPR
jgi:peptidoglycan hydrolase-like protein with peptidoglycan-binding domain